MTAGPYQPGMEQEATTASGERDARGTLAAEHHAAARVVVDGDDPGPPVGPDPGGPGPQRHAWRASSWPTMSRSAVCRPRPWGSHAVALTPGCTRCGVSRAVHHSGGEPIRSCGSGGSGPSRPGAAAGARRGLAALEADHLLDGAAAAEAGREHAARAGADDQSASPIAPGSRSCRAGSAPVIQAAPVTPPAPRTRPVRRREPPPSAAPGPHARLHSPEHARPDP